MKTTVLEPKEITLDRIADVFESALFEVRSLDRKDNTFVCKELGWRFLVEVSQNKQLITFRCVLGIDAEATELAKLRFANDATQKYVLVGVVVWDEDSLVIENQIMYNGGVVARSLIQSFRRFVDISKKIGRDIRRHNLTPGFRAAKRSDRAKRKPEDGIS